MLKIIEKPTPSGIDKNEDFHRHPVTVSNVGGGFW